MRSGPLAYIVSAPWSRPCSGVTLLVVTDNQISDRKAEVARLQAENAAAAGARRQAHRLHPVPRRSATSGSPR